MRQIQSYFNQTHCDKTTYLTQFNSVRKLFSFYFAKSEGDLAKYEPVNCKVFFHLTNNSFVDNDKQNISPNSKCTVKQERKHVVKVSENLSSFFNTNTTG